MEPTRRDLLKQALGAAALAALEPRPLALADDEESFWDRVRSSFELDPRIANLNNAGVSPAPRPVLEALKRGIDQSNLAPAHTMWRLLEPEVEKVRKLLATSFGCDPEEIAITRNASESLEICQLGLPLEKGDEVIVTDHDYPRMLATWKQRERRDGIVVRTVSLPAPLPGADEIVASFEKAITKRTRAMTVTHLTNRTGHILPVRRLCDLARQRGIEAIVDGAQSFAHFPFTRDELGCDYFGTSLHKWLMAPHGTGFLYVKKEKIPKLWPLLAAGPELDANVRKFEEIGTHPAANHNAIAEALAFHDSIGAERKAARLRFLRERWTARLGKLRGAKVLTSATDSCGIGLVSFEGVDPNKLAQALLEKRSILVTVTGGEGFAGVRVSPSVYTSLAEIDAFCAAVEKELAG